MPSFSGLIQREEIGWSTTEDRRSSRRHAASLRVQCRLLAVGGETWAGQVRNLSTYGIGLVLPKPPGLGQLLAIELARKDGTVMRGIMARVVHETRESSRAFVAGGAFVRELEPEHLQFFHADAVHPSGPDCRRWQRFPCNV